MVNPGLNLSIPTFAGLLVHLQHRHGAPKPVWVVAAAAAAALAEGATGTAASCAMLLSYQNDAQDCSSNGFVVQLSIICVIT